MHVYARVLYATQGPTETAKLQRVCRVFELSDDAFRQKVPAAVYEEHTKQLRESFMTGGMDTILMEAVEECPEEFDLKSVAEIRDILNKLQYVIEEQATREQQELRARRVIGSATAKHKPTSTS